MSKYLVLANSSDGLYRFRNELIAELSMANQVVAYTPNDGCWDELCLICKVHDLAMDRRGTNLLKDAALLLRFFKIIKKEKPDTVITYTIKPAIYGGICCRLLNKNYTVNITGLGTALEQRGFLNKFIPALYKVALKKAKVVFFENSENAERLIEANMLRKEQACVLAGAGVNTERYYFVDYPVDNGRTDFLFIGRIMKEKGIEELVSAVRRLHEEGAPVWLDIVGPYEEDYSLFMKEMEDEGFGKYHGEQSDVRTFIEKADCFVLPSYHEGMANTNLECASMGRPVITSNIPGCKEAIVAGVSGYLCNPQNVESLYEKMMKFINMPNAERIEMGYAGRAHIEKTFSKGKVVKCTIDRLLQ